MQIMYTYTNYDCLARANKHKFKYILHIRWIYLHDTLLRLIPGIVHDVGNGVPGETSCGVEQMHYIMDGVGGV